MSFDFHVNYSFSARHACPPLTAFLKMFFCLTVSVNFLTLRTLELNLIQASSFVQAQTFCFEGLAPIIRTLIWSMNDFEDTVLTEWFITLDTFSRIIKDVLTYDALEVIVDFAGCVIFWNVVSACQVTLSVCLEFLISDVKHDVFFFDSLHNLNIIKFTVL